jgi:hypothetical protein
MIQRVISSGQTGADQAGRRAAKAAGIPTGGAMPLGFLTEDGARPDFAAEFGAHEIAGDYPACANANVRASDGTIWFGDPTTPSGRLTLEGCEKAGKSVLIVPADGVQVWPSRVVRWIVMAKIHTLNVAGNRESKAPGIGLCVEAFLARVFRITQR